MRPTVGGDLGQNARTASTAVIECGMSHVDPDPRPDLMPRVVKFGGDAVPLVPCLVPLVPRVVNLVVMQYP